VYKKKLLRAMIACKSAKQSPRSGIIANERTELRTPNFELRTLCRDCRYSFQQSCAWCVGNVRLWAGDGRVDRPEPAWRFLHKRLIRSSSARKHARPYR